MKKQFTAIFPASKQLRAYGRKELITLMVLFFCDRMTTCFFRARRTTNYQSLRHYSVRAYKRACFCVKSQIKAENVGLRNINLKKAEV